MCLYLLVLRHTQAGASPTGLPQLIEMILELLIEPIPPDTVDTIREELPTLVREALIEADQEDLLTTGQIAIQFEKTLPIDWIELSRMAADAGIKATFALIGGAALKTFEVIVLPILKKRAKVWEKRRRKARRGKKKR